MNENRNETVVIIIIRPADYVLACDLLYVLEGPYVVRSSLVVLLVW